MTIHFYNSPLARVYLEGGSFATIMRGTGRASIVAVAQIARGSVLECNHCGFSAIPTAAVCPSLLALVAANTNIAAAALNAASFAVLKLCATGGSPFTGPTLGFDCY